MNFNDVDDELLMYHIGQQQEMALRELYRRHGQLLFSVAYRIINNRETAEEITLDVLVRVWEKGHTYDGRKAKVRTWLVQLTRNRAIDRLRQERIRLDMGSVGWEQSEPLVAAAEVPEAEFDRRLEQEAVREAVGTLPETQQTVLALAYFGGMTQREIAEHLDEPLGTVKGRVRAALKNLKRMLAA